MHHPNLQHNLVLRQRINVSEQRLHTRLISQPQKSYFQSKLELKYQ